MIASAAVLGINFTNGDILKQIYSVQQGDENPIQSCEMLKTKMQSLYDNFVFTIVANDAAKKLYAEKQEI